MMIEQNTNYAYKLKYMENPTFDKVRDLSTKFYRELPQALQDELFEALNRGIDILDSEPQMTAYLFAYGKMHKAKLNYAFEHLPETFFEIPEINIIDYGCGQAVATMCYADFLRKQGYEQKIRRVTLIEPSEAALKRAALHVSVFFPDAEIVTINKEFDDLETQDIVCDEDVPTLHLLSNVLDLECFSLIIFKKLVKKRIGPSNLFVCVGPYFGDKDRGKHMDSFAKYFKGEEIFSEDLDAYELDEDNSWTCMVRCFGVGDLTIEQPEEELSTEVTEEDIENGIKDEYGVIYSKDGKRLLSAKHFDCKTYTIKKGIKVICNKAFYYCKSLQSIVIPKSVISIGANPFAVSGVRSIVSHSKFFTVDREALYDQKKKLLIACFSKGYHFVIPDNVTSIGKEAFKNCDSLQSIVIPESVTSIEYGAFEGCTSLQSIAIPNSVKSIGENAFSCCKSLQSIVIPNSVTNIEDGAFSRCKSLQSIAIPDSVRSIGKFAFYDCTSLQSIVIPESVTSIGANPFENSGVRSIVSHSKFFTVDRKALYDQKKKLLIACFSKGYHFVIPDNVTSIGNLAFSWCKSLQSIVIPNSVTSIGDRAFSECHSLQSIIIPNSVKSIGDGAFLDCTSLQSIVIPNSVKNIGESAFSWCTSLQSIVIPNSVKSIGKEAFEGCLKLTSMIVEPYNETYDSRSNCNAIIEKKTNKLVAGCSATIIPNGVTSIGDAAFTWCTSLQSIIIPDGVTAIGEHAFNCCASLRAIIIPKGSRKKFEKLLPAYKDKLVEK